MVHAVKQAPPAERIQQPETYKPTYAIKIAIDNLQGGSKEIDFLDTPLVVAQLTPESLEWMLNEGYTFNSTGACQILEKFKMAHALDSGAYIYRGTEHRSQWPISENSVRKLLTGNKAAGELIKWENDRVHSNYPLMLLAPSPATNDGARQEQATGLTSGNDRPGKLPKLLP